MAAAGGPLTAAQQKTEMIADEDPLMISQSLTYVTDDGSILHSFESASFSTGASFRLLRLCLSHRLFRL